jgi:ABC-type dipeptide/oligopeptide/nickel transport system permease component
MIRRYTIRRLLIAVVQIIGITLAVFFLIRLLPADPVSRLVGMMASEDIYNATRANLGLDQPVLVQLGTYLGLLPEHGPGLLQGYLGKSWVTGSPILEEIFHFFPITLELIFYSFFIGLFISVPLGVITAVRPGSIMDRGVFVYGLFAGAQPEFWWGLFFIFIFFDRLGIAPAPIGRLNPLTVQPQIVTGFLTIDSLIAGRPDVFFDVLAHLVLPLATMVFIISGPIIKMIRQNMEKVLQSEFILYARASGLPNWQIAIYALRNAFAPSLTLFAILLAFMLGGAVLIETVFSWGGLGQYSVRSILAFDYPAIQGVILIITLFSLLVYLTLDVVHALLDPRVTLH